MSKKKGELFNKEKYISLLENKSPSSEDEISLFKYHLIYNDFAKENFEALDELFKEISDFNIIKDYNKNSWLHIAAEHNSYKLASFLIQKGINVNLSNNNALTPIHITARNNNFNLTKLLIDNKADVNAQNSSGITALHYSCLYKYFNISKLLIENGADVNIKNKQKQTPLFIATCKNDYKTVKILIEKGANINLEFMRHTPYDIAFNKGFIEIAELLAKHNAKGHMFGIYETLVEVNFNNHVKNFSLDNLTSPQMENKIIGEENDPDLEGWHIIL